MDNVSQKRNAIIGFIGGIIFMIGAAGVGGTALAHFNLGCLMPFTYKAMRGAPARAWVRASCI